MKAKYSIFVPNHARHVSMAAHHYLTLGPLKTHAATIHHGHPHDTVVTFADDTPEMDSHMKQMGAFVGELANVPSTPVTKETGKAVHTWDINNPYYQPSGGGEMTNGVPGVVGINGTQSMPFPVSHPGMLSHGEPLPPTPVNPGNNGLVAGS